MSMSPAARAMVGAVEAAEVIERRACAEAVCFRCRRYGPPVFDSTARLGDGWYHPYEVELRTNAEPAYHGLQWCYANPIWDRGRTR